MCTTCMATTIYDPTRHLDEDGNTIPSLANIFEGTDAAAGTWTNYEMEVGDTFYGSVDASYDNDWIEIYFEAGQTIEISLNGSGSSALSDPYLRVYDSSGTTLLFDDDDGPGLNSYLEFTVNTSGTYYIGASGFFSSTGDYTLSVTGSGGGGTTPTPTPTPTPGGGSNDGTLDQLADYLTDGYWQYNGFTGRSFDTSGSNQITVNISSLTAAGQQLARWAFEAWEMVADIEFVETFGFADINFDDNDSGAYAVSSTSGSTGGNITSSDVNISTNWLNVYGTDIDDYSFSTYIHEIGHALGLGHQGAYNGAATYGVNDVFTNDSYQLSIMSYFSQTDNTDVNASYADILTAQMADIIAIQNLYGAPGSSSATAGATTWGANSNIGGYLGSYFDAWENNTTNSIYGGADVTFTIYDQGGLDTFDISFLSSASTVDLNGGSINNVDGLIGNIMIARGTVIENLIAGSGADMITGNGARNRLELGAGNDTADGGANFDRLFGGAGNDSLIGGNGRDTVRGGDGADILQDNGQRGDLARDLFFGENGNDTVFGGGGNDTAHGGNGRDLMYGGLDNDQLFGGTDFDRLFGQAGNDTIFGGNGRDTMRGGNGEDRLVDNGQRGDLGRDLFFGENGADTIVGGGGNDTAHGGNGRDVISGGLDNDQLFGGSDYDVLNGNQGEDTILGGNGRDTMNGGDGNDRLVDNGQTGINGQDVMNGGSGNDTLIIMGGNDNATGGAGADTFIFQGSNTGADIVTDFEVGVDTLRLDDAMWSGGYSATQLISQFADASSGSLVFDFGNGNTITLSGITSTAGLVNDIEIF